MSRGSLVVVAIAQNQPEADLIGNLLREQGVPSLARRTSGFDVPDFLAAGPREILVPAAAEAVARELLGQPLRAGQAPASGARQEYGAEPLSGESSVPVTEPRLGTARPAVRTFALILVMVLTALALTGFLIVYLAARS